MYDYQENSVCVRAYACVRIRACVYVCVRFQKEKYRNKKRMLEKRTQIDYRQQSLLNHTNQGEHVFLLMALVSVKNLAILFFSF